MRLGHAATAVLAAGLVVLAGCSGTAEQVPTAAGTTERTPATTPTAAPTSPSPTSSAAAIRFGPDRMPPLHPSVDDYPEVRVRIDPSGGPTWDIPILLAMTEETRAHGLMEVPHVPPATGMGFVFPMETDGGFWMMGTETDLDIAWFDADGVVVAMTTMQVCEANPCPTYSPGAVYQFALEVTAGWLGEIGLSVGDRIQFVEGAGNTSSEP
jgi:hypothetical protein